MVNKKAKILATIFLVLIIVLIGGVYYLNFRNKPDECVLEDCVPLISPDINCDSHPINQRHVRQFWLNDNSSEENVPKTLVDKSVEEYFKQKKDQSLWRKSKEYIPSVSTIFTSLVAVFGGVSSIYLISRYLPANKISEYLGIKK